MHLMVLRTFRGILVFAVWENGVKVLMHLMALHAFWLSVFTSCPCRRKSRLNTPYGAPCFLTIVYDSMEGVEYALS